ncbi:MAG: helix-turn-helix transcriptional regulator [Candidatus Paceibacterota bacterium]
MTNFKTIKKQALKNKKVMKAYKDLDLEFSIIDQIIDKRIKKGMSQKDLALKIGTKQPSIARFESGDYNPTISFLKKISKALDSKLEIKI